MPSPKRNTAPMKALLLAAVLAFPLCACASTLTATSDAAQTITADTSDGVASAAGVFSVQTLKAPNAKLFTTTGGDPAINGLYTYYAVYSEDDRGWRSFMVGDFNDVAVVQDTETQTGLKVSKSHIDANGDVKTETLYLLIPAPSSAPTAVTVIPATQR